jgi:RNA polymerase sigma factor (sigma-70 family)
MMQTQLEAALSAALNYLLGRDDFVCESEVRTARVLRKREIPPQHWDHDREQIKHGMRNRIWEWLVSEPHVAAEFLADGPLPELLFRKLWNFGLSVLDELHPRRKMEQGTRQFSDGEQGTLVRQTNRGCESCGLNYRGDDGKAPDVFLVQLELKEQVRNALRVLDHRSQRILVGHYFEGLSWTEVAHKEELSPARITQVVKTAFTKLQLILAQA